MKKVGILGGTFDPIHEGHLKMGQTAYEQAGLDEVWFMPTGTPAYKKAVHQVTDKVHRAYMTELAIAKLSYAKCSYLELERDGNTYTADTLKELTRRYPDTEFYYIVGADSLDYMDRWYHPEEIFSRAVILVVMRNTQSLEEAQEKAGCFMKRFGGTIRILKQENIDISSTEIRNRVRKQERITGFVPQCIAAYMEEHRLYKDG